WLPDAQRLPVVLCDLEGLSYELAARHLRCTLPAFRCRLAKARKRLRARLTRRGVSIALGAIVTSHSAASAAGVPAAWARAAVLAATGGAASASSIALTQILFRKT